ncbi:MAG: rod shape-determining protein RodA [Bacteroidales bacterium]|nr:rod shape-determining protein RodA [Bacteroidales bacterium]
MRSRAVNIWRSLDWWVIAIYAVMVFAGWVSIYAASYNYDHTSIFDYASRSGKQLIWIFLALGLGGFILLIDTRIFETYAPLIYLGMIALLVVTIFVAPDVKGSRSWLVLGPVSLQPAEFGKFSTALMLAWLFNTYNFKFTNAKNFIKAVLIVMVPFFLIILQKETGSALVYLSFVLVFYREGMSGLVMIAGIASIIFFVIGVKYGGDIVGISNLGPSIVLQLIILLVEGMLFFFTENRNAAKYLLLAQSVIFGICYLINIWFPIDFVYVGIFMCAATLIYVLLLYIQTRYSKYLVIGLFTAFFVGFLFSVEYAFNNVLEPHQQIRIKVALGMEDDPRGAGYNVNQAKIAIGSGGLFGKGLLNGTQTKLKYVPEQDTDFIFCTIGEEEGFVGSVFVLLLFTALILRLIHLAERQRSIFSRVYGYCVVSVFLFHLFINVGMVIGLCPVIGIPLPLFSYGGSGLWSFSILLFIFLRLDASRLEKY